MKKVEGEISCEETQSTIKKADINAIIFQLSLEEQSACRHYDRCPECAERGLAKIIGTELTCREAFETILVHLNTPKRPYSFKLKLAIEHIWGRGHAPQCEVDYCRKLREKYKHAPDEDSLHINLREILSY